MKETRISTKKQTTNIMDVQKKLIIVLFIRFVTFLLGQHMDNGNTHNHTMNTTLRISAWNSRGMTSAQPYLKHLMQSADIVAISEHQMYECDLNRPDHIDEDFASLGRSSADLNGINRGRVPGHCGVAIVWRKSMSHLIRPIVIHICHNRPVILLTTKKHRIYLKVSCNRREPAS